jgi:hypothetical protein
MVVRHGLLSQLLSTGALLAHRHHELQREVSQNTISHRPVQRRPQTFTESENKSATVYSLFVGVRRCLHTLGSTLGQKDWDDQLNTPDERCL